MDTLVIGTWVSIHEGCAITCDVGGSDAVQVTFRGSSQPCELYFQADTLRQFVERGSQALAEMEAIAVEEGVRSARERTAPSHTGERSA